MGRGQCLRTPTFYTNDRLNVIAGTFKNWIADKRLPPCSIWTAFSRYLDITTPPGPQLLKLLAQTATNDEDRKSLEELGKVISLQLPFVSAVFLSKHKRIKCFEMMAMESQHGLKVELNLKPELTHINLMKRTVCLGWRGL